MSVWLLAIWPRARLMALGASVSKFVKWGVIKVPCHVRVTWDSACKTFGTVAGVQGVLYKCDDGVGGGGERDRVHCFISSSGIFHGSWLYESDWVFWLGGYRPYLTWHCHRAPVLKCDHTDSLEMLILGLKSGKQVTAGTGMVGETPWARSWLIWV